jgi:putative oxidoreductase
MNNRLITLASRLLSLAPHLESAALLIARLTLGVLFASSGWGKVHDLDKMTAYFGELHIPAPGFSAALSSWSELTCGALLAVGLASRLAAIPLVVTMTVALLTARLGDIHDLPDLFAQIEWTYIALLVVIVVFGPGKASLDAILNRATPLRHREQSPA